MAKLLNKPDGNHEFHGKFMVEIHFHMRFFRVFEDLQPG